LPQNEPEVQEEIPKLTGENGSLASPFLAAIPEQDRNIVAKYIKDWDAGVTKKFQDIHSQYEPYKNLGEIDRIQRAMEVISILEEDPQLFYENLAQLLNIEEEDGEDEMSTDQEQQEFEDPRDAELAQLRTAFESLSSNFQESQTASQEKQQMDELDNYMKTLHNEHGDFDDDWVLLQISKGVDPIESVKSWNTMINDRVSSTAKRTPPTIMSGNGSSPGGQVDPSKFNSSQRKEYIAAMLAASNQ